MAKTELVSAYVLHRRAYRESSFLVECFSYEQGRFSLISRSSKKKQLQSRGLLQPFTLLEIQYSGQGNLKYARQLEAQSLAIPLQGESLFCGLYLNELLYYLLDDGLRQAQLFEYYQTSLLALAKASDNKPSNNKQREVILRHFEYNLLDILGYQLELHLAQNKPIAANAYYHYLHGEGLVPAHASHQGSMALLGEDLLAIKERQFEQSKVLKTAKLLSRIALKPLLNGRELKSRQLFKKQK